MSEHDNAGVLRRAVTNFNDLGNREGYFDLYARDAVIHGYEGLKPGLSNIQQHYRSLWRAFPDVRLRLEDVFSSADRVACRFTIEGTHLGPFMGIHPTGRHVQWSGITILRFQDGKCVERWTQTDRTRLVQQLTVISTE